MERIPRKPKEARRIKGLIASAHRHVTVVVQRNPSLLAIEFVSIRAALL
jgi:hypothetical protein